MSTDVGRRLARELERMENGLRNVEIPEDEYDKLDERLTTIGDQLLSLRDEVLEGKFG